MGFSMKSLLVLVWITVTLVCITSAVNSELDGKLEEAEQYLMKSRNKAKMVANSKNSKNSKNRRKMQRQQKMKMLEDRIKKLEELIQCPTCQLNQFNKIKKRIGKIIKRNKKFYTKQDKRITRLERLKDSKKVTEGPKENFEGSAVGKQNSNK